MRTSEPVTILRKDYRPFPWRVSRVSLSFDLDEQRTRVLCTLAVERVHAGGDDPLRLDGEELKLESLEVDGAVPPEDSWTLTDTCLTLQALPDSCEIRTVAWINPEANTALEGLYRSSGTFCTQCEAEGFRKITWFPDRPDVLSVFDVEINAPRALAPVMLSNGNLVQSAELADDRWQVRWHDPHPKPGYLFALVAGDLVEVADTFTTASGKEVLLSIYVEAHNRERCGFAMASLKRSMSWDEQVYGLEYDLDRYMIVAVDDFNMGAMENKGLNVFNSRFVLADSQTATDTDFLWVEAVIAHEYFHNWTGNRVTCRDWFQLSLKEGLTVYRDQCFTADHHSATVKRIEDVRRLRQTQFAEDAGPLAHPVRPDSYIEINNFYTTTIYEKGAEVIRMMNALVGDAAWRKGMSLYFERHDGNAVTCEDFVLAMEAASGRDLAQFRLWYELAGTPEVRCEEVWDASAGRLSLVFSQHCPDTPGQTHKPPMHIPIAFGLLDASGKDITTAEMTVLELVHATQTFDIDGLDERPVVSLLRNFSAPVRLQRDLDDRTLGFIARHDPDGFTRWDAAQTLTYRAVAAGLAGDVDKSDALSELLACLGATLESSGGDRPLAANMLTLPSVSLLADEHAGTDVLRLDALHQSIMRAAVDAHRPALEDCVQQAVDQAQGLVDDPDADEFGFGGRATGVRALASAALTLLSAADEAAWVPLAAHYYTHAATMTDRIAALSVLCHAESSQRGECLADFESRFVANPLVLNKWFALQAMSRRSATLEDLDRLAQRPDFDAANPNRLRSLVGSFSSANPTGFHAAGGAGHAWLADWVIRTDAINPLTAARLVGPLTTWQHRDEQTAQSMKAQLQRILDSGGLSPDVYEQASKSLG